MIARNPASIRPLTSYYASMMDETTANESTTMCLNSFEEAMANILERRLGNDTSKAKALLSVIFRCTPSSSLQARFTDPAEALNYSLQQLASALRARIARKETKAKKQPRELQLTRVMGRSRYEDAKSLVHMINMLRHSRGASACPGWGPCSKQRSLPTLIPSPASQLFFHTQLARVMEGAPPASFADQDWENLMKQAKEAIQEYVEWSEDFKLQQISPIQNQEPFKRPSIQSKEMLETAPVLIEDINVATPSIHPLPLEPIAKRRRL